MSECPLSEPRVSEIAHMFPVRESTNGGLSLFVGDRNLGIDQKPLNRRMDEHQSISNSYPLVNIQKAIENGPMDHRNS